MDPSPKEIARLCREIQATWSEWDRLNRQGIFDREPYYVPDVVSTVGLGIEEPLDEFDW